MDEPDNETPQDRLQTVDTVQIQTLTAIKDVGERVSGLTITIKALNEMLASHVRANIETTQTMQAYLEGQLRYRAIREEMDESRLQKELEQKTLEVEYLGRKVDALLEENQEAGELRLQYEQAKLEIEKLKMQTEILQTAKKSTLDKLKPDAPKEKTLRDRVLEGMVMTSATVVTASLVGGFLAFVYYLFRQWVLAGGTP